MIRGEGLESKGIQKANPEIGHRNRRLLPILYVDVLGLVDASEVDPVGL